MAVIEGMLLRVSGKHLQDSLRARVFELDRQMKTIEIPNQKAELGRLRMVAALINLEDEYLLTPQECLESFILWHDSMGI